MRLRIVRVERNRALVRGNGVCPFGLLLQHRSEVIVAGSSIGPQADLPTEQCFGANEISLLGGDDREVAARFGMVRIGAEHFMIQRLGIFDRAVAVRVDRSLKQSLRCHCHRSR
jgi:hypothetical protein